jgi:hypothetical protein
MDEKPQVIDWTFLWDYVPSRKTAYFTVEKDGMTIDARCNGWLDENLELTTKKKAVYILGRRWSYDNGTRENIPQWFAVKLPA